MHNYKSLKVFFEEPILDHYFREIVKKTKGSPLIIQRELKELLNRNLILSAGKIGNIKKYKANRDNEQFIFQKQIYNLDVLFSSGLIPFLVDRISPNAILLIGSYSKGADIESSDIDLALIVKRNIDFDDEQLKKYEKLLNRKIHIHIVENFSKLSNELKNNIVNGFAIYGFNKVF